MDKLKDFSTRSLMELKNDKRYKNYSDFPQKKDTDFSLPNNLPNPGIK